MSRCMQLERKNKTIQQEKEEEDESNTHRSLLQSLYDLVLKRYHKIKTSRQLKTTEKTMALCQDLLLVLEMDIRQWPEAIVERNVTVPRCQTVLQGRDRLRATRLLEKVGALCDMDPKLLCPRRVKRSRHS